MRYPQFGTGSIAPIWKRLVAIIIDWSIASLLSFAFFQYDPLWILILFSVPRIVLQILFGFSIGQLLVGIHLTRVDGKRLGLWAPIIRTVLLILVIPAVIVDPDQRGIHDIVANTAVISR